MGDFRKKTDGRDEATGAHWMLGKHHRKVDAADRMRGIMRYADDMRPPVGNTG